MFLSLCACAGDPKISKQLQKAERKVLSELKPLPVSERDITPAPMRLNARAELAKLSTRATLSKVVAWIGSRPYHTAQQKYPSGMVVRL